MLLKLILYLYWKTIGRDMGDGRSVRVLALILHGKKPIDKVWDKQKIQDMNMCVF
jgi:hypothetical protein